MHPDINLLFKEINFLILVAGLFFLLRKPVKEFFANRAAIFRNTVEASREQFAKTQAENWQIQEKLKNSGQETNALLTSFKDAGELEGKRIVADAKHYAEKIREDAKKIASAELRRANEELKAMTAHLSKELAERMVREELHEEEEARMMTNYVQRLKNVH